MFKVPHSEAKPVAYALLTIAGFGAVLIAAIMLTRWQMPTVRAITPTLTGQTERCLTCHNGIEAISVAHSIEEFGCVTCHAGNGLAVDETGAHSGLVVNPASLDNAPTYCGECHAAQVLMVERSIMTTYAGAIALIRRAFGAQETGQAEYAARAVGELKLFSPTPEDLQPIHAFAQNCQTCHISAEPQHADYFYRSTGCASCHVLYGETGFYEGGDPAISKTEAGHASTHTFTTAIPYTQCNHCHNRGNYDLRTMTFVPRADIPASEALTGEAKRLHDYYQPISQFTRCEYELDCIDCHTQQEIMGDGMIYNNRSEAQYTQCKTCHGTPDAPPLETVVQSDADLAMTRANLNPLVDLAVGDSIMMTERGEALYHVRRVDGQWLLTGKATGQTYSVPLVQGSQCTQDPNDQSSASCHQCHQVDRAAIP